MAVVGAIGTIAGTIAGVKALLPAPPPALTASFSQITANPEVGLEQYDARAKTQIADSGSVAKLEPSRYRLAAYTTPTVGAGEGETKTGTTSPAATTSTGSGDGGSSSPSETHPRSTPTSTTAPAATTPAAEPSPREPRTQTTPRHFPKPRRPGGHIVTHPREVQYPKEVSEQQARSQALAEPPQEAERTAGGAKVTDGAGVPKAKVSSVFGLLATPAAPSSAEPREGEASPNREGAPPSAGGAERPRTAAPTERPKPTTATRIVLPTQCRTKSCGATQEVEKAITYDPNPVRAAQAVAAIFKSSRSELVGRNIYPLGAEVSYDILLKGFANRHLTLEWSLLGRGRQKELAHPWWHHIVVAHITPTAAEQTVPGKFWVPEPPEAGNYTVHLVLLGEHGVPYASSDSAPTFH